MDMRFWLYAMAIAAALSFAGATGSRAADSDFPDGYLSAMTQSCESAGGVGCACVAEHVGASFTHDEFEAMTLARTEQRLHSAFPRMARIADACNPPTTPPTASVLPGYTDGYVANFVSGCNADGQAGQFCLCAVDSVQRMLSFDEAIEYDALTEWRRAEEHPRHDEIFRAYFACADQFPIAQRNTK